MNPFKYAEILLIGLLILGSCSENENSKGTDSASRNTLTESGHQTKELSFEEVYALTKPAGFPQVWDEEQLDYGSGLKGAVTVSLENFKQFNLLKNAYPEDSVYFLWKYEQKGSRLIMLCTTEMNAKGISFIYHLVTLGTDNRPTDEMLAFAQWAVSTSNPYGGTSAGLEYKTGQISTDLIITTKHNGEEKRYEVTASGFREIKPMILLDYPYYTEAYLKNIVNNIDYISFEFEDNSGKMLYFNYTRDIPTDKYFRYEEVEGSVIPQIIVSDTAKKRYKLRYIHQYFEGHSTEIDTYSVLTGMVEPEAEFPHYEYYTEGVFTEAETSKPPLIKLKEQTSGMLCEFVITDTLHNDRIRSGLSASEGVQIRWEWDTDTVTDFSAQMPRRMLLDYTLLPVK